MTSIYIPSIIDVDRKLNVRLITSTIVENEVMDIQPANVDPAARILVTGLTNAELINNVDSTTLRYMHKEHQMSNMRTILNPFQSRKTRGL